MSPEIQTVVLIFMAVVLIFMEIRILHIRDLKRRTERTLERNLKEDARKAAIREEHDKILREDREKMARKYAVQHASIWPY